MTSSFWSRTSEDALQNLFHFFMHSRFIDDLNVNVDPLIHRINSDLLVKSSLTYPDYYYE